MFYLHISHHNCILVKTTVFSYNNAHLMYNYCDGVYIVHWICWLWQSPTFEGSLSLSTHANEIQAQARAIRRRVTGWKTTTAHSTANCNSCNSNRQFWSYFNAMLDACAKLFVVWVSSRVEILKDTNTNKTVLQYL